MQKKIKPTTLTLIIVFMILPVLSVLMLHHITISETLANMDSGSFGKIYEMISLKTDGVDTATLYESAVDLDCNLAITADEEIENERVRSVFFNKNYVNLPMKKGRFFRKSDFKENKYCAVIGKNKEKETYTKGKKTYIMVNGIELEVLGVIGYECDTVLDEYIYINGFIQDRFFEDSMYLVDFLKVDDSDSIMEQFMERLHEKGIDGERLSSGQNFFNSIIPRLLYSRWFIILLVCDVLCLILLSMEWIQSKKQEIGIRKLLGATKWDIMIMVCKKYLFVLILSIGTGIFYSNIFYPSYGRFLLMGYAVLIPVLLMIVVGMTVQILKTPIEEAIK